MEVGNQLLLQIYSLTESDIDIQEPRLPNATLSVAAVAERCVTRTTCNLPLSVTKLDVNIHVLPSFHVE